jgi:hypothetical protein
MRFSVNETSKYPALYFTLLPPTAVTILTLCSYIFIFDLLLPEGRAGEAREPFNKLMLFLAPYRSVSNYKTTLTLNPLRTIIALTYNHVTRPAAAFHSEKRTELKINP